MLFKYLEAMTPRQRTRFGRSLKKRWDSIITGDVQREFTITEQDLRQIVVEGNFAASSSLIKNK